MKDKTQPESLRLADAIDPFTRKSAPDHLTSKVAANELRRQHARIAELEAQLEAVGAGGVQALSAAPAEADMFWDAEDGERFGNDIDDIISDFGPGDRVKINCAKRMPSIEVLVVADGDDLTYQIVSPTPPAEQQAAPKAAPGEWTEQDALAILNQLSDGPFGQSDVDDALDFMRLVDTARRDKAAPGEQFDSEGFRAWVLRNLPDETIIGSSAWWADHLTTWAQRFVKAAPQQEAQEPVAWESTILGYIKYITQAQYEKFRPNVRRWYKPYKCSSCSAPQPAPAPLSDDVVKDAARYRWLREEASKPSAKITVGIWGEEGNSHCGRIGSSSDDVDTAIDAAMKGQS